MLPGADLCLQGTEADRMWVLSSGAVEALQYMAVPIAVAAPCVIGETVMVGDEMPAARHRCFTVR